MIICCIGDSLTEGDYGIPNTRGVANVHAENYPHFLARMTGAEVRNYGRCGCRAGFSRDWYRAGGIRVQDADIVIILLGTNGGQSADGDSSDNQAYRELVAEIRRDAPAARVYLCTPPHVTVDPAMANCGYAPQVAEAVGFVRRLATETGLPLIDLAADPHFTDETEKVMQPNDGLHFTETGYRTLAAVICAAIGCANHGC